ncbi:MAG: HlyD family type I secretion periplasmic adaptor subunit [Halocynthiibacter sp.]
MIAQKNHPEETDFPVRGKLITGLIALTILLGGGGWWAFTTQIAGAVVSQGQIRVEQQRQVVQHPDGGVVEEVLVEDGQFVSEGALLIRLDPALLQAELSGLTEQRYELLARKSRLEAERDESEIINFPTELTEKSDDNPQIQAVLRGQNNLFITRLTTLASNLQQLENRKGQVEIQLDGIASQQDSITRQTELLRQELATQQSLLERGLAQAANVLALQREEARLLGQSGELSATAARAQEQISELEIESLRTVNQRREDALDQVGTLRFELVDLDTRISNLRERLVRLDVHAPVSGIVYGLQIFAPRAVIRPADEVMALVPQDRPLVLEVNIDPIHIDQVYLGQDATLRFSAFSADTPELFGTVAKISADAFSDPNTGASYYRAEVALNDGEASRLPEDLTLLPGMPVEAYIRTSDRTPIAYLVKPLSDYFNRAFRED